MRQVLGSAYPRFIPSLGPALGKVIIVGAALAGLSLAVMTGAALAQDAAEKSKAADNKPLGVELNKLEKLDGGCRAYVVVTNKSAVSYRTMQLDLVLFRSDGIIGRRLALELAPIPKEKRRVKLFDLDGVSCDDVGTFLINDIMECRSDDGPADDCLSKMTVTSRTKAKLSK